MIPGRYSSCRYNERQLIDVTVVRRVRPRAERWCDCEGHRRWKRAGRTLFAIDLVMHLLLNGTSLVTRDGAEDAGPPMSVYLTLVFCANSTSLTSSCSLAVIVDEFPRLPILSKLMGSTMRSTSLLALLRQTKVSPVQASLGPKSMTALSEV